MKILVDLFLGYTSKVEIKEVEDSDFKIVKYSDMSGYRRRSSIWFVDYSHLDKVKKEELAKMAVRFNEIADEMKELHDKRRELKEMMKSKYCKTQ